MEIKPIERVLSFGWEHGFNGLNGFARIKIRF